MKCIFCLIAAVVCMSPVFAADFTNLVTCDNGNISIDYQASPEVPGQYDFQMVLRNNAVSYVNQTLGLGLPQDSASEVIIGGMVEPSINSVWNNNNLFNQTVENKYGRIPYWFEFSSSNILLIRDGEEGGGTQVGSYQFNNCYRLN
jgi:hypothetical protein